MRKKRKGSASVQRLRRVIYWSALKDIPALEFNAKSIYDLVFRDGVWCKRSDLGLRGSSSGSINNKLAMMRKQLKLAVDFHGVWLWDHSKDRDLDNLADLDELTIHHGGHEHGHFDHCERKFTGNKTVWFMFSNDHMGMHRHWDGIK